MIWAGLGLCAIIAALTLTPVLFIIINSFNAAPPSENWRFGFDGWREAFGSPRTLAAIGYTFILNIRSVVAIAVAFLFSWLLVRVRIPGGNFIEFSLWIAYFLPSLPLALSWILLLDPNYGLINQFLKPLGIGFNIYSLFGIAWIHLTATTIPIMTILLAPVLRQLDASLEEAARMCGAGSWQTFRRVLIPLLSPALFTVFLASLIRGLEAFQVELLLGKPIGVFVYATRIYDLIQWEPPLFPQAMALSTLFLGLLFVLALFYQRFTSKRVFATISARGVSFRLMDIGRVRYAIAALLIVFVAISVYLPLVVLVVGSLMKLFGFFTIKDPFSTRHWVLVLSDPVFLSAIRNSIALGIGTASLGLFCYCLIGYALVRTEVVGRSRGESFGLVALGDPRDPARFGISMVVSLGAGVFASVWKLPGFGARAADQRDAHRRAHDQDRLCADCRRAGAGRTSLRGALVLQFPAHCRAADFAGAGEYFRHRIYGRRARHRHDHSRRDGIN